MDMPHSSRAKRRRTPVALVVLLAFFVAPTVAAEIFKCVAKDGAPQYQNFPCHVDSLGLPSSPPVASTPSMNGATGEEKSKAALVSVASTAKATNASDPRVGMTADEVRALLGEPENVEEDEPGSGGRVSTWRYPDGRTVQFNHKQRVSGVKR